MNEPCHPTWHFASQRAMWSGVRFSAYCRILRNIMAFRPCLVAMLLSGWAASGARAADNLEIAELFRTGKYSECIDAANEALTNSQFDESLRVLKLRSELELGRYSDALNTLDDSLKKLSPSIELRWWGRVACRFAKQPERAKLLEQEIGELLKQTPWRYSDAKNLIVRGRFYLSQGVDPKLVLDGAYNAIKKQQPGFVPAYLASGDLALDKNDFELAARAFEAAIKLDAKDPEGHFGLARAFAPSDSKKSAAEIQATLDQNPNHVECLLLMVDEQIDSEEYVEAEKILERVAVINPHHPRAAAYRSILAHLKNQPERERTHREAGLKFWSDNPEVDHLIGKKLSQKYRFAEGAEHQRTALKMVPEFLPAKVQLAQDLLRLGREDEGWKLAKEIYQADGYNVVAHNLVTLQDSVEQFRTLEEDGIIARMDAREADIYGHRVLELLKRAKRHLCKKYDVEMKSPIIVEMFPRQEDFAIRTFGLPGGAGFLGVCFGTVITANSPASQGGHPTCWESTLWHEFCHVVTLNKTHNKMPRWLSEGISVYEERQADPTWGQSVTPQSRKMLLGDELTPVDQLSGAFLRPPSPQHLQFAYFESSLVVEFLVEKYGIETLKKILDDLGQGITINDSLARHTGSLEELNKGFVAFARHYAESMAPDADWSEPELPKRIDPAQALAWLKAHPNNYPGLLLQARQFVAAKRWEAAKQPLEQMRKLYPNDDGDDSLYPLLARVHRELGETPQERAVLERFAELSDDNLEMFARLTELTSKAEEWELTRKHAERWLAVDPLQAAPHRILAESAERLQEDRLAIDSYRALLLLSPINTAELHLRLSKAFQRCGDLESGKLHALLAVEEAPRFRAGHRQLLAVTEQLEAVKPKSPIHDSTRPSPPELPETETRVLSPKTIKR